MKVGKTLRLGLARRPALGLGRPAVRGRDQRGRHHRGKRNPRGDGGARKAHRAGREGLGNGFFDAAAKARKEAAKELGDVEIIYTGPTKATAEGQIEVINALIAQKVDAHRHLGQRPRRAGAVARRRWSAASR